MSRKEHIYAANCAICVQFAELYNVKTFGGFFIGVFGGFSVVFRTCNPHCDVYLNISEEYLFIIWPLAGSNFIKQFHKKGIIRRCVAVTDLQGNEDLYQIPSPKGTVNRA